MPKIKLGISGWVEREGNKRIVRPLQKSRSLMIEFISERGMVDPSESIAGSNWGGDGIRVR